jgi:hypothetical protein
MNVEIHKSDLICSALSSDCLLHTISQNMEGNLLEFFWKENAVSSSKMGSKDWLLIGKFSL